MEDWMRDVLNRKHLTAYHNAKGNVVIGACFKESAAVDEGTIIDMIDATPGRKVIIMRPDDPFRGTFVNRLEVRRAVWARKAEVYRKVEQ